MLGDDDDFTNRYIPSVSTYVVEAARGLPSLLISPLTLALSTSSARRVNSFSALTVTSVLAFLPFTLPTPDGNCSLLFFGRFPISATDIKINKTIDTRIRDKTNVDHLQGPIWLALQGRVPSNDLTLSSLVHSVFLYYTSGLVLGLRSAQIERKDCMLSAASSFCVGECPFDVSSIRWQ
jgi:hypothetical protein